MKKLLNSALIILLLTLLCGCGQNNPPSIPKQNNALSTPSPFVTTTSPPQANIVQPQQVPKLPTQANNVNINEHPLRFVVLADSRGLDNGINTPVVKKILEGIKKLDPQPSFALMPGDLVDGADSLGKVTAQLEFFKKTVTAYYPINFFYPGIGNHEVRSNSGGEKAFNNVFSEFNAVFLNGYNRSVYFIDAGNTRFFMLNSDHPGEIDTVSNKQLDFVKANTDPLKAHNIFLMHEPPYPTSSHVGSSLDANRLQRDRLWTIIDGSASPLVFCGHEHLYSRRHIDSSFNEKIGNTEFKFNKSVYQLTTGTFGAPFYTEYKDHKNVDVPPIPQYHFAVVDIKGGKIKVQVINIDGKTIDSFEQ